MKCRGRPRKGWKEEVERDLQVLGVRRWTALVTDWKEWKDIVRQAKPTMGCRANGRRRRRRRSSNNTHFFTNHVIKFKYPTW